MPPVIAGPILRHVSDNTVTVWLVVPEKTALSLLLYTENGRQVNGHSHADVVQVGSHAFVTLLQFTPDSPISANVRYNYRIQFDNTELQAAWQLKQDALCYKGAEQLHFVWQSQLSNVLHGSCRKPHYPGPDSLTRVDESIQHSISGTVQRPDMLIMSGDQVYVDDVAGPMLQAIHQVIDKLGLFHETLDGALVNSSDELASHQYGFYQREQILPQIEANTALSGLFFGAKKKPIFTSVNAQNHLISTAEVLAMYLLCWSEELWCDIEFTRDTIPADFHATYDDELAAVKDFITTLPKVRRALAHVPVYMIFDDHDVTDDWNLTRGWEQEVYGHPLSRRMIGNALIAYLLCQGWGNQPQKVTDLIQQAQSCFTPEGIIEHDALIDALLDFSDWHYQLDTTPPVHVLDTRTQRWRSESSLNKPSGLMDWEALCEFQQGLIGHDAVIVVSAAPIYGVKIIEAIQKVFTFFGKALTVDAENWMAHKGTASVILNIFRHYRTPPHFIILSGDVHYSFVYDVRLRFRRNSPKITQFTCSGFKNTFPPKLIRWLDRLNQGFYGPRSPLNFLTRRRNMTVYDRHPDSDPALTLLNKTAVGQLQIDADCSQVICKALCGDGETVEFPIYKESSEKSSSQRK